MGKLIVWLALGVVSNLRLLFGGASDDLSPLLDVDLVAGHRRFGDHRFPLVHRELLAPRGQRHFQSLFLAGAVALVVLSECVENDLLVVGALRTIAENGQEHGEIDGSRRLGDHRVELVFRAQSAERVERLTDVVLRDEAILVLIDHLERLLERLHLVLREHGEHVRAAALSLLLGAAFLIGLLALLLLARVSHCLLD